MKDNIDAQAHRTIAGKYYLSGLSKLGLSAAFTGFGGYLSQFANNTLVYVGAGSLLLTDVGPTLSRELSPEEQANKLLVIINIFKKLAAFAEGAAIIGVYVDKILENRGNTETADAVTDKLIPSFAAILLAKGTLALLTDIEKLVRRGINFETVITATIGSGGTLVQSGLLIAFLKALIELPVNGMNATIGLGQAGVSFVAGFWHSYKALKPRQTDPEVYQPLASAPISVSFSANINK